MGLAIPGILSPVTGALLHELSSIPVIANSAQLIGVQATSGVASEQFQALTQAAIAQAQQTAPLPSSLAREARHWKE